MNDILDHPTSTILLAYDVALDGTINKEKIFNCFDCRVPVIMYAGHVAVVYPGRERSSWWIGEDYVKFPLTVQCKNNECRHRYCFLSPATREPKGFETDDDALTVL